MTETKLVRTRPEGPEIRVPCDQEGNVWASDYQKAEYLTLLFLLQQDAVSEARLREARRCLGITVDEFKRLEVKPRGLGRSQKRSRRRPCQKRRRC